MMDIMDMADSVDMVEMVDTMMKHTKVKETSKLFLRNITILLENMRVKQ